MLKKPHIYSKMGVFYSHLVKWRHLKGLLRMPGFKKNVKKSVIARSGAILNPAADGRRDLVIRYGYRAVLGLFRYVRNNQIWHFQDLLMRGEPGLFSNQSIFGYKFRSAEADPQRLGGLYQR